MINNKGKNNPNYKKGNRMTGNFPCPMCGADRTTEKRYADRTCRDCYHESRRLGLTEKEKKARYIEKYKKRRRLFKDIVIEMYGDECWLCKNSFPSCVYTFHHLNPKEKDKNPSSVFRTSSWKKIEKELRKCAMLCQNCHMVIHWGEEDVNLEDLEKRIDNIWDDRTSLTYS